jgi:hypothetical protein
MHRVTTAYRELRSRLRPVRRAWRTMLGQVLLTRTALRWNSWLRQRNHPLRGELIVSLTSFPPRFATLAATLKCLLSQSVRPDRVVLWVSHADLPLVPLEVTALVPLGLEIRPCDDIGAFKKLIPALRRWPSAYIVTADDDVYYDPHWLKSLIGAYRPSRACAPCHRAHNIRLDARGARPAPYRSWRKLARPGESSPLVFPTGVGGVLYPPGSLHRDVLDEETFTALCPTSDDAWVYWMALRNGWQFERASNREFVCWPGSQVFALQHANVAGANDRQIANLCERFGYPAAPTPEVRTPISVQAALAW